MRIINVIEFVGGILAEVRSYPIEDDQLSGDIVELAENDFTQCLVENGCSVNDTESFVEYGSYRNDDYSIFLTWSAVR